MAKQKFYTVWIGREMGVFDSWEACKAQVEGFQGAKYKSFDTRTAAEQAFLQDPSAYMAPSGHKTGASKPKPVVSGVVPYEREALAVDAACSGNPGDMEYRGVYVRNGQQVFLQGVYHEATNNIGEFLAIVHGLALLKQKGLDKMILYSDSRTAMAWVKARKCKTKLVETEQNALVFERIRAAENWLATHSWSNEIRKWETEKWGEIPADFGRK
ncbi:MAG: ribonuclease H family protein [Paludibacteraceae bacterium]|nr:ribonuclease H family protein [Paludibacteraceae bacterium]